MTKTIAECRAMPRAQIKALNKEALIDIILGSENEEGAQLRQLQEKLLSISTELTQFRQDMMAPDSTINRKMAAMQAQIDQQADVIKQQQLFMEAIDRKERETKLVVLGVPEEDESMEEATNDEEKLKKIWSVMGEDLRIRSHRRLGRRGGNGQNTGNSNRKRPILVEVDRKEIRDTVIGKTKRLKEAGSTYERIYVKKDVHPSVHNEWKRLRQVEMDEKTRPENEGCVIRLDPKERKIYRDGEVIDSWKATSF